MGRRGRGRDSRGAHPDRVAGAGRSRGEQGPPGPDPRQRGGPRRAAPGVRRDDRGRRIGLDQGRERRRRRRRRRGRVQPAVRAGRARALSAGDGFDRSAGHHPRRRGGGRDRPAVEPRPGARAGRDHQLLRRDEPHQRRAGALRPAGRLARAAAHTGLLAGGDGAPGRGRARSPRRHELRRRRPARRHGARRALRGAEPAPPRGEEGGPVPHRRPSHLPHRVGLRRRRRRHRGGAQRRTPGAQGGHHRQHLRPRTQRALEPRRRHRAGAHHARPPSPTSRTW
jgi:hypothetical protein